MSAALKRVKRTVDQDKDKPFDPIGEVARRRVYSNCDYGMTPLMHAVCDGSVDEVRELLDEGVQVNARRDDGFTALSLAAFFGRTELVKLLSERGADFRLATRCGTSAEMWATARGFQEISELLRAREEKSKREGASLKVVRSEPDNSADSPNPHPQPRKLPEVIDLEPAAAPAFHPGQVFLARITSSSKHLTALLAAVTIVLALVIFSIYQMGRALKNDDTRTQAIESPAGLSNPGAQTYHPVIGFEQAAIPTGESESSSRAVPNGDELMPRTEPSKSRTSQVSPNATRAFDLEEAGTTSKNSTEGFSADDRVRPTRLSRPSYLAPANLAPTEKIVSSDNAADQHSESDRSAPAPLTIEPKRDPAAKEHSEQDAPQDPTNKSAPLGITSSKAKSKVIQWP